MKSPEEKKFRRIDYLETMQFTLSSLHISQMVAVQSWQMNGVLIDPQKHTQNSFKSLSCAHHSRKLIFCGEKKRSYPCIFHLIFAKYSSIGCEKALASYRVSNRKESQFTWQKEKHNHEHGILIVKLLPYSPDVNSIKQRIFGGPILKIKIVFSTISLIFERYRKWWSDCTIYVSFLRQ